MYVDLVDTGGGGQLALPCLVLSCLRQTLPFVPFGVVDQRVARRRKKRKRNKDAGEPQQYHRSDQSRWATSGNYCQRQRPHPTATL